jgi:protein arginine N-methyltransferase 1
MKQYYNLDMSSLSSSYNKEQIDYYIYSSLWTELSQEHVIGQPQVVKRLDLNSCTLSEAAGIPLTPFDIVIPFPVRLSGFAGWFSVDFNGSKDNQVSKRVKLSTGPEVGYTHWGQQVYSQ